MSIGKRRFALPAAALAALALVGALASDVEAKDPKDAKVQKKDGPSWPFGDKAGGVRALDLYNLGVLGVKVADAQRPLPGPAPAGRRVIGPSKDESTET